MSTVSPLAKYKLVCTDRPAVRVADGAATAGLDLVAVLQVFLGDQSVGKTSIITRFMYDKFDNTYQAGTPKMLLQSVQGAQADSRPCRLPLA